VPEGRSAVDPQRGAAEGAEVAAGESPVWVSAEDADGADRAFRAWLAHVEAGRIGG
jgi:hypothetical protein